MKHIILASASPRRKEILELADLKFDVMPSDAQEITTKTAPNEVVMELASIKAKDIYKKSYFSLYLYHFQNKQVFLSK